jgi:hypothetical protein
MAEVEPLPYSAIDVTGVCTYDRSLVEVEPQPPQPEVFGRG